MDIVKLKTDSPFEERESFSRVVAVGDWIFMSNTAGANPHTKEMPADAAGQAEQAFINVETALDAAGATLADVVRARITVPVEADVAAVMAIVGRTFRGIDPVMTVTCAPLAGFNLRFEIEVTAFRGAGSAKQKRLRIVPRA